MSNPPHWREAARKLCGDIGPRDAAAGAVAGLGGALALGE